MPPRHRRSARGRSDQPRPSRHARRVRHHPRARGARGYETITDSRRLAELKIVKAARDRVPGLLVPLLAPTARTWGYQYRPDIPRLRDGKPVKYETPWQQRNGLDIPPGVGTDMLGDPNVPLWITEGTKKADCGAHYQAVHRRAVRGVELARHQQRWAARPPSPTGMTSRSTAAGSILAFDGDVARNTSAAKALCALAAYLGTGRQGRVPAPARHRRQDRPGRLPNGAATPSKTCGGW